MAWLLTLLLTLAFQSLAPIQAAGCGTLIRSSSFNKWPSGPYKKSYLERDFDGHWFFNGRNRARITSKGGSKYLSLKMQRGCVSTHSRGCGMVGRVPILEAPSTVTLEYIVRFAKGFKWNKGGKLLGVCSDRCPTGCHKISKASSGFSARAMWGPHGELYLYSYTASHTGGRKCGYETRPKRRIHMRANKDYRIRIVVSMGSAGSKRGSIKLYINGSKLVQLSKLRLRSSSKQGIDTLLFHTFYGGDSKSWRAPSTTHISYRSVRLWSGDCGGNANGRMKTSRWRPSRSKGSRRWRSLTTRAKIIGSWGGQYCVKYYVRNRSSRSCRNYVHEVSFNPVMGKLRKYPNLTVSKKKVSRGWYTFVRRRSKDRSLKPWQQRYGSICIRTPMKAKWSHSMIQRNFMVRAYCTK